VDQVHSQWTEAEGPLHREPRDGMDEWSGGASPEWGGAVALTRQLLPRGVEEREGCVAVLVLLLVEAGRQRIWPGDELAVANGARGAGSLGHGSSS
jgi:hypothetical protein